MPKKLLIFKEIQQNHNLDISLAKLFLSPPQKWFVQLFQYVGHYGLLIYFVGLEDLHSICGIGTVRHVALC